MTYPKRCPFFAYKYIRLMAQTCAAAEMGPYAVLLCSMVAMQEDVIRYTRAVTYYNAPLMEILGVARWETLNKARQKAVEAGWLHYEHKGKRKAGVYFVTIPAVHQELLNIKGDHSSDAGPDVITMDKHITSLENSYNNGFEAGVLSLKNSDRSSDNASYRDSDNASVNDSEPSTLSLSLEPEPLAPGDSSTGNTPPNGHSKAPLTLSDDNNDLRADMMTLAQFGCSVSYNVLERESAEHLCGLFTSGYLAAAITGARKARLKAHTKPRPWLGDVSEWIRENPPEPSDRIQPQQTSAGA